MKKYFYFFFSILIFLSIFTISLTCNSENYQSRKTLNISVIPYDSLINVKIKEITNTSIEEQYNLTEDDQTYFFNSQILKNAMENINPLENIENDTNPSYNCTKYNEPFQHHFLILPKVDNSDVWYNAKITKILYYFTPIFKNITLDDFYKLHTYKELKQINDSYGKSFSHRRNTNFNFNALLDHYARRLTGFIDNKFYSRKNEQVLAALSLPITYFSIIRRFFSHPYEFTEIDNIIFNIIIPFRNKVNCILYNKKRQNYCKICLKDINTYDCCSIQFYDQKTKFNGEQYIKNAAQALHLELSRYIKTKQEKKCSKEINCFYDNFTVGLCRKINYDLLNQEPIM